MCLRLTRHLLSLCRLAGGKGVNVSKRKHYPRQSTSKEIRQSQIFIIIYAISYDIDIIRLYMVVQHSLTGCLGIIKKLNSKSIRQSLVLHFEYILQIVNNIIKVNKFDVLENCLLLYIVEEHVVKTNLTPVPNNQIYDHHTRGHKSLHIIYSRYRIHKTKANILYKWLQHNTTDYQV